MNLESYVISCLENRNIPLVTTSKYKKDVVSLILVGYRKSGWSASGSTKFIRKYFPNKPKNIRVLTYFFRIK